MALSAVQVVTAIAAGAGTEAGRALGDVVRARLGTSGEGRAALARVSADPTDPVAAQGLQEAIREALAADPEFRGRVAAALAGPAPAAPPAGTSNHSYKDSIVIGSGSRIRRSQISLGPLTINNSRSARAYLTAGGALLLALLTLAVYGGTQIITGDELPESSDGTSPRSSRTAASSAPLAPSPSGGASAPEVRDPAAAKRIFPGPESLPEGWAFTDGSPKKDTCPDNRVGVEEDETLHYICKGSLLDLTAWYAPEASAGFDRVLIEVVTYSSRRAAVQGYLGQKAELANNPPDGVTVESLPSSCDRSAFFSASYTGVLDGVDRSEARSVVHCGTVMFSIRLHNDHGRSVDLDTLGALSKTVAARTRQTLNGETPTAAFGSS